MLSHKKSLFRLVAAAAVAIPFMASAQNYYDDDIYFNADKAAKQKAERQKAATQAAQGAYYVPNTASDFPAADTYTFNSGSTRDVDEYNRRGQFLVSAADTLAVDSLESSDTFANTRRIERFHNSDIISQTGDDDLASYYYSQQPQTVVNVNVVSDPWAWRYGSPWYVWNWGIYDPWYSWNFGPSWAWGPSWSWGPAWSWGPSWGWGPSWSWGPGWGPGWNHGWAPAPPRPITPSGSSRPHSPAYAGGGRRPSAGRAGTANGYRPGASGTATRPGNMGRGRTGATGTVTNTGTGTYRPASSAPASRPGNMGRGRVGSTGTVNNSGTYNTGTRGRQMGTGSSSTRSSGYNYNRGSSSSRSSGSSYSPGRSTGMGRSTGGGYNGGGGGGGRGRR